MRITILARTRMGGGRVCVGGMSEAGESFRLMSSVCGYHNKSAPFQVGQAWEIRHHKCEHLEPPHLEDVAIDEAKLIGTTEDLRKFVLERATPWQGGIDKIFDGKLQFTGSGSGYISHGGGLPSSSTGFWIPDRDLRLGDESGRSYSPAGDRRHIAYVGTAEPRAIIPRGSLVRVSLAKWWKPREADANFEVRCYAQLSGWY